MFWQNDLLHIEKIGGEWKEAIHAGPWVWMSDNWTVEQQNFGWFCVVLFVNTSPLTKCLNFDWWSIWAMKELGSTSSSNCSKIFSHVKPWHRPTGFVKISSFSANRSSSVIQIFLWLLISKIYRVNFVGWEIRHVIHKTLIAFDNLISETNTTVTYVALL